jgi:CTP synthase
MPFLGASQEVKTKPAQNAVRELRGFGIVPDVLVARSEYAASQGAINKLSLFSGVAAEAIAMLPNAKSIYEIPLTIEDSGLANVITRRLGLRAANPDLSDWREVVSRTKTTFDKTVTVGVVAKYMDNTDTYISVFEALRSAAAWNDVNLELKWIKANSLDNSEDSGSVNSKPSATSKAKSSAKEAVNPEKLFKGCDGIVIPGGFGIRGLEGKIKAAQYALKEKLPYLGLCLGLQMAVIAAARNAGVKDATTTEYDPDATDQVISTMEEQIGKENTGGTMRLGNYKCNLKKGSMAAKVYGTSDIVERHRHRYECNNEYRAKYESWGILPSGINPDNDLVEIIEGIDHPFFMASQFHPEFKSRPNRPHPMFDGFMKSLR